MSLPLSASSSNVRALRHCSSCTCHTTSTDTPIELDPHIAASSLDQEIVKLEEVVAQNIRSLALLKRRRNTDLHVGRVPPEVLSEVFLYSRGDLTASTEIYMKRLSWIDILHVSSHWRAVAFATPHLWNTLNLRFPRLVDLFVAHCGTLPLSVMLPTGKNGRRRDSYAAPRISADAKALRSVNNPIVDLRLHGIYRDVVPYLKYILSHTSQDVRVLVVCLEERGLHPIDVLDKATLSQLHTLRLTLLGLQRDSVLLQGCAGSLRELELVDCHISMGLGVLGILSSLEKLYIDASTFEIEDEGDIVLPALKVLTLKYIYRCTDELQHLKVTSSCRVSIFTDGDDNESFSGLMACISAATQSPSRPSVDVHFSKEILTIQRGHHMVVFELDRCWGTTNEVFCIVRAIVAPVATALALSCEEDSELTQDNLLSLVRDTSITSLDIGGHGTFLDALARCIGLPDAFLPGLAQLQISDADFTELSEGAVRCWSHGVAARRGVLVDIRTVDCIGVPPPALLSESTP